MYVPPMTKTQSIFYFKVLNLDRGFLSPADEIIATIDLLPKLFGSQKVVKFLPMKVSVDIESFWTECYAGQSPNGGHELAIYVL